VYTQQKRDMISITAQTPASYCGHHTEVPTVSNEVSIPGKEHWLHPERIPRIRDR